MKYTIRGYIFNNGVPIRIPDGTLIVNGWEEAEKGLKNVSPYYLFTLDEIPEEKEE